jgi:hypothetical protein
MYKIVKEEKANTVIGFRETVSGGTEHFIPAHDSNYQYLELKETLANGGELADENGTPMTADAIKTFLEELA